MTSSRSNDGVRAMGEASKLPSEECDELLLVRAKYHDARQLEEVRDGSDARFKSVSSFMRALAGQCRCEAPELTLNNLQLNLLGICVNSEPHAYGAPGVASTGGRSSSRKHTRVCT